MQRVALVSATDVDGEFCYATAVNEGYVWGVVEAACIDAITAQLCYYTISIGRANWGQMNNKI